MTALIAIAAPEECDPGGVPDVRLMTELHIFNPADGRWYSERGGMPLRHETYWWLPETEIIEGIEP
jgi:hypothetical protein